MIISHHVTQCHFLLKFLVILCLETILVTFLIQIYRWKLDKITEPLDNIINQLNEEVALSFHTAFNEEVQKYQRDLLFIGKHLSIFKQKIPQYAKMNEASEFYKSFQGNCLVKQDEFDKLRKDPEYKDYLDHLINNSVENVLTDAIQLLLKNKQIFPKKQFLDYDNNEITDILMNLPSLDKIVYYSDNKSRVNSTISCYLQIVLKSLVIKHILQEKTNVSLLNYQVYDRNNLFVYPLNDLYYSKLGLYDYYFFCSDNTYKIECGFNTMMRIKFPDPKANFIFSYYDSRMVVKMCLIFSKEKEFIEGNYIICSESTLNNAFPNLYITNNDFEVITIVPFKEDKDIEILAYFTINTRRIEDYKNYYNIEIVPDKFNIDILSNQIFLFHVLYYEIFHYIRDKLTKEKVNQLIIEYDEIKTKIIESINQIGSSLNNNVTFQMNLTFLDYDFNTTGLLDKSKFFYII